MLFIFTVLLIISWLYTCQWQRRVIAVWPHGSRRQLQPCGNGLLYRWLPLHCAAHSHATPDVSGWVLHTGRGIFIRATPGSWLGGLHRSARCGMPHREGHPECGRLFRRKRYFKSFWTELLPTLNFICDFDLNNMYTSCDLQELCQRSVTMARTDRPIYKCIHFPPSVHCDFFSHGLGIHPSYGGRGIPLRLHIWTLSSVNMWNCGNYCSSFSYEKLLSRLYQKEVL